MICNKHSKKQNIASLIFLAIFCFAISCNNTDQETIAAVTDRATIPVLDADTVHTVISDSGITRYRITTPSWQIYDKAEEPYWEFPQGILLEQFNQDLTVDASVVSNYAYYNENEHIWRLDGNVRAVNLSGEMFETEQLFWNQHTEHIYSDSIIKITRESSIITGIGFESNQTMTNYTIRKPQGVFPIDEDKDTPNDQSTD